MDPTSLFRVPRTCLPRAGIDLNRWAVVACDQYTSEPGYWQAVAHQVGDAPSTLHLTFPEVFLGQADAPARIARIQATMREYLAQGLLVDREGAVYVERTVAGRTRRGLMLELDLEHYDFSADSTSLIRPTEGTIVARLAPRIEVRRGAELELPHILVLIDDPGRTVIEPLAAARTTMPPLYQTPLMQGGGDLAGWAVPAPLMAAAATALQALGTPEACAARYGLPASTPPMLFAVGDGNHSLATAKAIWESQKASVGPQHASRYALVEVENIHDTALAFEPIHRLLFGVRVDVRVALTQAFGNRVQCTDVPDAQAMRRQVQVAAQGGQACGLVGPGARFSVLAIQDASSPLVVGTIQGFIDNLLAQGGAADVDYVHGDDVLERLGQQPGHMGWHLPVLGKSELLGRVLRDGPLPRKTFSMGEAHEKRFYMEARRIR
ncbi:MAG TPA: DUF1015 domain-containing protein [Rubrivivax sp.]|nr:DUF1015 domain-containing protein [Rubrivivax sp.]